MSYTIGFQAKNQKAILATEAATANQAVAIVAALRQSADEIKFIRSPASRCCCCSPRKRPRRCRSTLRRPAGKLRSEAKHGGCNMM